MSSARAVGSAAANFGFFNAADLPITFPPLNTLDNLPNNLSQQVYPLVGRDQEVVTIARLLARPAVRVLTLIGPVGTGKTRLAIQVAANLLPEFAAHAMWRPKERAWIGRMMEDRDAERLKEDLEIGVRLAESLGLDVSDVEMPF